MLWAQSTTEDYIRADPKKSKEQQQSEGLVDAEWNSTWIVTHVHRWRTISAIYIRLNTTIRLESSCVPPVNTVQHGGLIDSLISVQFSSIPWPIGSSGGTWRTTQQRSLSSLFLQEAVTSSFGVGRDVHSLMLSIQHFLCRPRRTRWREGFFWRGCRGV